MNTQVHFKFMLVVKIKIQNTSLHLNNSNSNFFIVDNTIKYVEVAISQLIQIHENFKYHDLITLEFRRLNSDSVTEVITPQSGAQSLQE